MKVKKKAQINISIFKTNLILPAIVLSLSLLLQYNPLFDISVKSFNRTLGNGMLHGIDITKRINNISFFDFLLVPIILFFVYLVISILCRNINEENNECIEFINTVSAISLVALIFAYINKFSNENFFGIEVIFPCTLIVLTVTFLSINHSKLKLNFDVFKWCIFATMPIMLFVTVICNKVGITISVNTLSFLYFGLFIVLFLIVTLFYNRINFHLIKKAYLPVMIAPMVVSLFLELTNILNQYSIFINSKFKITFIIYIILGFIFLGYYLFLSYHENCCGDFLFEKYYYPIALISIALISVQLPLKNTFGTDFFEQSNHGTAISELFNFGKIPIIETFDAHMLQNQIGNILYGLLNNDFKGAIFLGYSLLPIIITLYYFMFTKFFNRDIAFFLMLIYPIAADNIFILFSLAPIVILSFLYAYRVKNYKGYLLYWISVAIACLFRLDMGFALAFSSIITWGIMWFFKKNEVLLKKLILSCMYVLIISLMIFLGICLLKEISPMQRVLEFLNLCQSNVNWGNSSIGDTKMTAFVVCYFMVPSIAAIMIVILVFKKWKDQELIEENKFIIILIVGLLCIFNFSRGLVRHSLGERSTYFIISTAPLFISMFIYIFMKRSKLLYFIISNVILMIVFSLTVNSNSIFPRPLINSAVSRYLTFNQYNTLPLEKTERVVISDEMKKVSLQLKGVLDKTLLPNETYIDFTNQTLMYAMTEREKPMYVNQSPALLSGEYTQQRFIEECEQMSKKTPFVLMPIEKMALSSSLDEIQNSYRYYLVSEYINNNFKPLFRTSKFALWCRKDRYDEKANLVSKLIEDDKNSYSKVILSEECTNILNGYNANMSIANNKLIIKSTNPDPIIIGLDKLMNFKEMSSDYPYVKISIDYDSDKDGLFELFYRGNNDENFDSQKAISKDMPKSGVFEATIPYTKDTTLRFDLPDNSTVEINNISFKGVKDLYKDDIKNIDYNYAQIEQHSYDLMNIPYIWANYDKIGIDKKEKQLTIDKKSSIYDFSSINKQDGNYLLINASASKVGNMKVQLGKEDKNEFTALSEFNFSLNKGNSQNYLVRLSSDFMWYSEQINAIKITSDNNATLDKTSILKGDTLK